MAVNKVVINRDGTEEILVDLTADTINADALTVGFTAHSKTGETVQGANPYGKTETDAIVNTQSSLLDQAIAALNGKAAGGGSSGGNNGPFTAAKESIWIAPSKITSGYISIPHSLGVVPDGFYVMAVETELGNETEYIVNNSIFDKSMLYAGNYPVGFVFGIGTEINNTACAFFLDVADDICTSSNIIFQLVNENGTQIIPSGKQYRVLVYKR